MKTGFNPVIYAVDEFALIVSIMLQNYPGQDSQRLLGEAAYLYIRGLSHGNVIELDPAEYLRLCGFDEETVEGLAHVINRNAAIRKFASENNLTSEEDMEILLALLGLRKRSSKNADKR